MSDGSSDSRSPPRRFPEVERREASMSALDLEPLMTVCPKCGTRFRVTETQLQAARGRVRCGTCSTVFDGVDQLVLDTPVEFATPQAALDALDELMAELVAETRSGPPLQSGTPDASETPCETADDLARRETGEPNSEPELEPQPELELQSEPESRPELEPEALAETAVATEPAAPQPSPLADPVVFGAPRRRGRTWRWLLVPVAVLAVAAQVLWYRFDTLVRDPTWRPVYAQICNWIGCELPVQRAVHQIRTRNLTVRASPDAAGTLQVRVAIVNEAAFPQPFPVVELRFSALNGTLVAGHRFQPREYLDGDARNLRLMPPGTPVQLELTIPDPGAHAVNYEMTLR